MGIGPDREKGDKGAPTNSDKPSWTENALDFDLAIETIPCPETVCTIWNLYGPSFTAQATQRPTCGYGKG